MNPRTQSHSNTSPEHSGKLSAPYVDRQLIHLRIAGKNGLLTSSDPKNVILAAANLIAGAAHTRGRAPIVRHVVRFVELYSLDVSADEAEEIAERVFITGDGWLTGEGIGQLLNLTIADQETFGLWTLGVHGETYEQQKLRTSARQKQKKKEAVAKRDADRGPFWINVKKESRDLGISKYKVQQHREAWIEAVSVGDFVGNFHTFVEARIITHNTHMFAGRRWRIGELADHLNCSYRSIERWIKIPGKIEDQLKIAAGRRPSRPRKAKATACPTMKKKMPTTPSAGNDRHNSQRQYKQPYIIVDENAKTFSASIEHVIKSAAGALKEFCQPVASTVADGALRARSMNWMAGS